jgi:hypothetical protein
VGPRRKARHRSLFVIQSCEPLNGHLSRCKKPLRWFHGEGGGIRTLDRMIKVRCSTRIQDSPSGGRYKIDRLKVRLFAGNGPPLAKRPFAKTAIQLKIKFELSHG